MAIQQLSVFVENKQGALCDIISLLSENGINLRAVSIADTQDFGVLRMIVNDCTKAYEILKGKGVIVKINHVIGVELPDEKGALSKVLNLLSENGSNVEYLYAFVCPGKVDSAYLVVRTTNSKGGEEILRNANVKILTDEEIERM